MVRIDMTQAAGWYEPGKCYLARIDSAKTRDCAGGSMFAVAFVDDVTHDFICYDNIVLTKKSWGITKPKLICLGVPTDAVVDIAAAELIGRKVWILVARDDYMGKSRLGVDISGGEHGRGGYWSPDNPPSGYEDPWDAVDPITSSRPLVEPQKAPIDDNTPF